MLHLTNLAGFAGIRRVVGPSNYIVENSALFDGSTGYLDWTPPTAGNKETWTFSCWYKLTELETTRTFFSVEPTGSLPSLTQFYFSATDTLNLYTQSTYLGVDGVYRDPTAWQHVMLAIDSAAGSDEVRVFINGLRANAETTLSGTSEWNSASLHNIGRYLTSAVQYFSGHMAEVLFVDGQALEPTEFGETHADGVTWLPKQPAMDFGQNGFYLQFADSGFLGKSSKNPTAEVFATLNPNYTDGNTYSNGNLTFGGTAGWNKARPTLHPGGGTGKWYCEAKLNGATMTHYQMGFAAAAASDTTGTGDDTLSVGSNYLGQTRLNNAVQTYMSAPVQNDILMFALNYDDGELYIGKNSQWGDGLGGMTTFASAQDVAAHEGITIDDTWNFSFSSASGSHTADIIFADDDLTYTPPTGYKTVSTTNLPAVTGGQLSDHFATVLYTGNSTAIGSGGQAITGVGFQPDLVWVKNRDSANSSHLYDRLRGTQKSIESDTTGSEGTQTEGLSSFDADGFTVGSINNLNASADNYVAWCWKLPSQASGSTSGTGTAKTYTSRYNADLGIELIKYTGNGTAGHTIPLNAGLGKAPFMAIFRPLDHTNDWSVYSSVLGNNSQGVLNVNFGWQESLAFNNTDPTSTIFTLGTNVTVNTNDEEHIAIVFYETDFTRSVNYEGNGNADGPFAYLHGQPQFWLEKNADATGTGWLMCDNKRSQLNDVDRYLFAEVASAEGSGFNQHSFESTGIKIKNNLTSNNASGNTIIGLAHVEPAKTSLRNGHDWATNGTVTQTADSPNDKSDGTVGNLAVLNPLDKGADISLSNGNRSFSHSGGTNNLVRATLGSDTLDYYFEVEFNASPSSRTSIGVTAPDVAVGGQTYSTLSVGEFGIGIVWSTTAWTIYSEGTSGSTGSFTGASGDVFGVHVRNSTNQILFYHQGTLLTTENLPNSGGGTWLPTIGDESGGVESGTHTVRFDNADWTQTPAGITSANALSTANLPEVAAVLSDHFKTVLYTGNGTAIGSGGNAVTGVGFQPDFVWVKDRSAGNGHHVYDSLRGTQKSLMTDTTGVEGTQTEGLASFDADGFTVGSLNNLNASADNYAAWCMKLADSDSTNETGSITSTIRANTTLGVSVGTYTGNGTAGATIGHGLGKKPFMVIVKNRDNANSWMVYHEGIAADAETDYLLLDTTGAAVDLNTIWNDTAPDASVFTVGNDGGVNFISSHKYIFMAFAETDLCRKVSYQANSSTDGPFEYLGGLPAFYMVKDPNNDSQWGIYDDQRSPYNPRDDYLAAESTSIEQTNTSRDIDFVATGVKHRSDTDWSFGTRNYIGVAFVNPLGVPGAGQVRAGQVLPPAQPAGISYTGTVTTAALGVSTHTFASSKLGKAAANRKIILTVACGGAGQTAINSVTVDGIHLSRVAGASPSHGAEIWDGDVLTANDTGDIVVTYNGNTNGCQVGIYTGYGIGAATNSYVDTTVSGTTYSVSADVPAGGFAIGLVMELSGNGATVTWSGLDENWDQFMEDSNLSFDYHASHAFKSFISAQSGLTISATYSARYSTGYGLVVATYGEPA